LSAELERLEQAYAAGISLLDGWRPMSCDLAGAPTISDWTISQRGLGLFVLTGKVIGHPSRKMRRNAVSRTSAIIWLDKGWARTIGRFYLLGPILSEQPLPDNVEIATAALTYVWSLIEQEQGQLP